MRKALLFFMIVQTHCLLAEGTRELAPQESIVVSGMNTTDVTALFVGKTSRYGTFADYTNTSSSYRLNVRIVDPEQECLHLGFSSAFDNVMNPAEFRFYVKDPNGNVIYQSDAIRSDNAPIQSWQQAVAGPKALNGIEGYDQVTLTSTDLISGGWSGEGDYYVEFEHVDLEVSFLIPFWDITVASCIGVSQIEKKGRVWSDHWILFTPQVHEDFEHFDRPFNGAFYIVAPDELDPGAAFITKMDFKDSGFHPAAFSIALNNFGCMNSSSVQENRKSVSLENRTVAKYPIFLNDPKDLYRTADQGTLSVLSSTGCIGTDFCFNVSSSMPGEVEVLLDFYGNNGQYDENTADIFLTVHVAPDEINAPICIPWDGIDGSGRKYDGTDLELLEIFLKYRQGIFHFPVYDVEINRVGFRLSKIRPSGANPKLHYDDSDIPFDALTGSPNIDLVGCEPPCHSWTGKYDEHSYGNLNTINSWWYSRELDDHKNVLLRFTKEIVFDTAICAGQAIHYLDSVIVMEGEHVFYHATWLGCDSLVIFNVDIVRPNIEILTNGQALDCNNPSKDLRTAVVEHEENLEYYWKIAPNTQFDLVDRTNITITTPGLHGVVAVHKTLGCLDTAYITVQDNFEYPDIEIVSVPSFTCKKEEAPIELKINNQERLPTLNWSTIDGYIVDDSDPLNLIVDQHGLYVFESMFFENGCKTIDTIHVIRDTNSYVMIFGEEFVLSEFCTQVQINLLTNTNAYEHAWWSPDSLLSCSQCLNPTWLAVNEKPLTFTIRDTNACTVQHVVHRQLIEDYKIYIPDAFSPNNDGINDNFGLFSSDCPVYVVEFSIYDRWGNRVFTRENFQSTDSYPKWNGNVLGRHAIEGTYVYAAKLRLHNDELRVIKGNIHLVR